MRIGDQGGMSEIVYAQEVDFARPTGLYGLFATRRAALEKLRPVVDGHRLCTIMTGLEKGMFGRACFGRQINRFRGACIGLESAVDHHGRLKAAFDPDTYKILVKPMTLCTLHIDQ